MWKLGSYLAEQQISTTIITTTVKSATLLVWESDGTIYGQNYKPRVIICMSTATVLIFPSREGDMWQCGIVAMWQSAMISGPFVADWGTDQTPGRAGRSTLRTARIYLLEQGVYDVDDVRCMMIGYGRRNLESSWARCEDVHVFCGTTTTCYFVFFVQVCDSAIHAPFFILRQPQ